MPEQTNDKPAGNEPKLPDPPRPQRRKRSFKLDKEAVVTYVLDRLKRDLDAREEWNTARLDRYAKLRGWLPEKSHPMGAQASNVWIPIILIATMRLKAGLENATKSMRPLMQAKAVQQRNTDKEENINRLIDYQLFVEANGERVLDDYISSMVDDGTVVAFERWVRRDETIYDVRSLPSPSDDLPLDFQIFTALKLFFPEMVDALQQGTDYTWKVFYKDEHDQMQTALVDFYDTTDDRIEAHITTRARVFDGPAVDIQDLEDIVVPMRTANLQPQSPENPHGAPYVNRICITTLDEIRGRRKDGTYDLITDEDIAKIEGSPGAPIESDSNEQMKELKDQKEGQQSSSANPNDDLGQRVLVEHYGRWDVNGDGFDEDVIFWIARDSRVLMRARYLTEMYPGVPIRRPFAETRLFPVPNRFYGMSLPEIIEPIQDMMKAIMDQNFDWGLLTNIPFFFYRPSSGLKQEDIVLQAGMGYPVDRPQEDVYFPTWNRDMSWTINTLTLLQQYDERLSMQSDVQFGRVPTGKASALRTAGTTAALLQQGDVRSEQILRRLFLGFAQIYQMIHRLNRRYLPKSKELRVIGISEAGRDPYVTVTPDHIDADIDFEFNATLLNTSKQILSQSLMEIMSIVVSPIAVQLGLVDPDKIYKLFRDMIKSRDLDPDRYLNRPAALVIGPKYSAEDVLSLIMANETPHPTGGALEPIQEHIQKLIAFAQDPQKASYLNPNQMQVLEQWVQLMIVQLQQQMAQQALIAGVAGQGQQNGNGKDGPGGAPTTASTEDAQENPQVGPGESVTVDEEGL